MGTNVSLAEAKATLSACIRRMETGVPVIITRRGRPVAALVPPEELEHLQRLRHVGPEGGLASLAGGWEGSEELAQLLDDSPRVGQRLIPTLD